MTVYVSCLCPWFLLSSSTCFETYHPSSRCVWNTIYTHTNWVKFHCYRNIINSMVKQCVVRKLLTLTLWTPHSWLAVTCRNSSMSFPSLKPKKLFLLTVHTWEAEMTCRILFFTKPITSSGTLHTNFFNNSSPDLSTNICRVIWPTVNYKVVQIWPGQTVTCLDTISPGHIWTTLYYKRVSQCALKFNMHPLLISMIMPLNYHLTWCSSLVQGCIVLGSSFLSQKSSALHTACRRYMRNSWMILAQFGALHHL